MDMGLLSSDEVIECTASDLIGQYVGQTGPKTKKMFERALGRVLFVDEAYRLGEGHFAKEAMDELTGLLTHETFMNKVVVVLAGYDQQINELLQSNPGLSSRFSEEVVFPNIPPDQCMQVLHKQLIKTNISFPDGLDTSSPQYAEMLAVLARMARLPSWGNARDVITMAKQMSRHVLRKPGDELILTGNDALTLMRSSLHNMEDRLRNVPSQCVSLSSQHRQQPPPMPSAPPPAPTIMATQQTKKIEVKEEPLPQEDHDGRDPGVSDAIWNQLQADILEAENHARMQAEATERLNEQLLQAAEEETKELEEAHSVALKESQAKDQAEQDELKRRREEARLREANARVERERIATMLEERRRAEEVKKRQEAKAQAALREMGICPAGYRWVKQAGGYRCSAGGHFVDNAQLGI